MTLPLIGITCSYKKAMDDGKVREWAFVYKEYFDSIAVRDGLPFLLPPLLEPAQIPKALARLDGLIVVGGNDMNPQSYGQPLHPSATLMEPRRDAFDLAMARCALDQFEFPIFCICQGSQLLNVVLGGDLVQDIPDLVPGALPHETGKVGPKGHLVRIEEDSQLKSIAGRNRICVNSYHHQAIGRVADGLRVVARCETDEVIEAVEITEPGRFVIGVQWHPELEGGDAEPSARLFDAFLTEARAYAAAR